MDTDDLTPMAYDCILYANAATDVLKSELGALCSRHETEDECLRGMLQRVRSIEKHAKEYLESWNLIDEINIRIFRQHVKKLREFIEKVLATPIKERGEVEE